MADGDSRCRTGRSEGLWWLCLVAAPVVLVSIELFHSANFTRTHTHPDAPGMLTTFQGGGL